MEQLVFIFLPLFTKAVEECEETARMVFLVQPIIAFENGRQVINTPVTKSMQDVCSSSSDELCTCVTGELAAWTTRMFTSSKQTRRRKSTDADSSTPEVQRDFRNKEEAPFQIRDLHLAQIKSFSLKELRDATKNFRAKYKVGVGGFGSVYRGKLTDRREVAVKRLAESSLQGEQEFMREVQVSSLAKHRNLVPLYGYCHTDKEILLVYPFVSNGDLQQHLKRGTLDWRTRQKVALGVSRALAHMHEYCYTRIIHRDVKPANVLLDDKFEPFLTDFGLAIPMKDVPFHVNSEHNAMLGTTGWSMSNNVNDGITHVTTRVMGTFGYAAPEYLATGHCSEKNDVYAFGVMLLQLTSGLDDAFLHVEGVGRKKGLVEWARNLMRKKKIQELVDSKLQGENIVCGIDQMIRLGLMCTMDKPKRRPKMSEATRMLEGVTMPPGWKKLRKKL